MFTKLATKRAVARSRPGKGAVIGAQFKEGAALISLEKRHCRLLLAAYTLRGACVLLATILCLGITLVIVLEILLRIKLQLVAFSRKASSLPLFRSLHFAHK